MIKKIFLILIWSSALFGLELSKQLPQESVDLINSFDCFSAQDKAILNTYLLLLDYRIEHVDDPDVFEKTDKDYWKLFDVVNDIGDHCDLAYNYDNFLENTLIDTSHKQNKLSRLRRIEGKTHYARAKYDNNDYSLIDQIIQAPPKFSIIPSKTKDDMYNLSTLKNFKDHTIPKKIYDEIISKKLTKKQKNVLLKIAYLKELQIRLYDQVDRQKNIKNELQYLAKCQEYYHIPPMQTQLRGNKKRELSLNMQESHSLSTPSILPNEAIRYCEHNVTDLNISAFVVRSDPKDKINIAPQKKIKLKHMKKYLKKYANDPKKKKYADRYLMLTMKALGDNYHGGAPSLEGLELLRLDGCLGEPAGLHKALSLDIKDEDIKEKYIQRIGRSQMWWLTTIAMKIQQEGGDDKLKHFFDCNNSQSVMKLLSGKKQPRSKQSVSDKVDHEALYEAKELNENIFRYFSKVFYKKSAMKLNTQKAIKAGIVPLKFIRPDHQTIRSPFGGTVSIEGFSTGGIQVIYTHVPKGETCNKFVEELRDVTFGHERYEGADYVLINKTKVKTGHFLRSYIKKLCLQHKNNTIVYAHKARARKYKYNQKRFQKIDSIMNQYVSYFRVYGSYRYLRPSLNHRWLLSTTYRQSKYYDIHKIYAPRKLPRMIGHYKGWTISNDGNVIVASKSNETIKYSNGKASKLNISILDGIIKNNQFKQIQFIDDNKTVIAIGSKGQVVILYDVKRDKLLTSFIPHLVNKAKEFNRKHLKIHSLSISPDHNTAYVVSSIYSGKAQVEMWQLKSESKKNTITPVYVKTLPSLSNIPIGAISINKHYPKTLVVGTKKNVLLYDLDSEKIQVVFDSGGDRSYEDYKHVELSDDGRWILGQKRHYVEVWRKQHPDYPFEVFKGDDDVQSAFFMPAKHELLIASRRSISLWATKDRHKALKKQMSSLAIQHKIKTSENPVYDAVVYDRIDLLKQLLKSGASVNKKIKKDGATPLTIAVIYGRQKMIKLLLDHGALINTPVTKKQNKAYNPYELTLLLSKSSKILKTFIDHGVDVNKKLPNTKAASLRTALWGCPHDTSVVKLLLKYGANPTRIAEMPYDKLKIYINHCRDKKMLKRNIKLIKQAAKHYQ